MKKLRSISLLIQLFLTSSFSLSSSTMEPTADFIKTCQIYNVSEQDFVKCSTESIQGLFDNIYKGNKCTKVIVRKSPVKPLEIIFFQELLAWRMCKWIRCV